MWAESLAPITEISPIADRDLGQAGKYFFRLLSEVIFSYEADEKKTVL